MSNERPPLYDMLGNEIKVGDVMALPNSDQGYSQRIILIDNLPFNEKTGKWKNIKFMKLSKDMLMESNRQTNWRDGHSWNDAVKAATLTKYGIVITDIISKDKLDSARLLLIK